MGLDYALHSMQYIYREAFGLSKLLLKKSTVSSLGSSFSDSVSPINIGNQTINLYGGPEVSAERESIIISGWVINAPFNLLA